MSLNLSFKCVKPSQSSARVSLDIGNNRLMHLSAGVQCHICMAYSFYIFTVPLQKYTVADLFAGWYIAVIFVKQ